MATQEEPHPSARAGQEFARAEQHAADAARDYLLQAHSLDCELIDEQASLAARSEQIDGMDAWSAAHMQVAHDIETFLRRELSGSDRAWRLLERDAYASQLTPGLAPIREDHINTSSIHTAFSEIVRLRPIVDLPIRPHRAAEAHLTKLLHYLETVRHGSRIEAVRLKADAATARRALARDVDRQQQSRRTRIDDLRSRREQMLRGFDDRHSALAESLVSPSAQDFSQWGEGASLAAPESIEPMYLGSLQGEVPVTELPEELSSAVFPWARDLRDVGNLVLPWSDEESRAQANAAVEEVALRALSAFPPGSLRLAFIDPMGLGRSDASFLPLADHNPDLVHRNVRSSRQEIEELLQDMVSTISRITQRYLRGTYSSIDEYNKAADEIAEPYRLLVIHDYPQQFEKGTTLHLLERVLENGPRCGIHTVITANSATSSTYEPSLEDVLVGDTIDLSSGTPWIDLPSPAVSRRLVPSGPAAILGKEQAQALTATVVDRVGHGAQNTGVTTSLDRALSLYEKAVTAGTRREIPDNASVSVLDDPSTWWQNDSTSEVVAPVGPSSAREAAVLRFDSESTSSALLIGRPGSGKSTLLHTWMSTLTTLYSPEEVELLLVDFKEGVEFASYARFGLPHASCVAIESEREFGLSVLQEMADRIKQRSIDFKRAGGATSLKAYRRVTGEVIPRVFLVFDEFQVLFAQDDRIGLQAAQLLETIIRQGRGFGIHVFLGSQSLSGMVALNRQVLQMVSTRILLPSSADDAALALGESTTAHRLVSLRGEGVMTTDPNATDNLLPFRVAYEPDAEREARLSRMREHADRMGMTRRPTVFSSERTVTREELRASTARTDDGVPVLTPGASVSLAPPPLVRLIREPGRHLLAILKEGDEGELSFTTGIIEDVLTSSPDAEIFLVPLVNTPGLDPYTEVLADVNRIRVMSRRALPAALTELYDEVQRRQDQGSSTEDHPIVLLLHGVHRARDLAPEPSSGFSFDEPETMSPTEQLEMILTQGPECGVHIIAWSDTLSGLTRRLSRTAIKEFDLRLASTISPADASEFFEPGVTPAQRPHQAVLHDLDTARTVKLQFVESTPAAEWRTVLAPGSHAGPEAHPILDQHEGEDR